MEPLLKSPKQIFFEWNRNTFKANNELTYFVESLYANCENRFAPVYKRFIENNYGEEFNLTDLFHVIHYIGILHASLPVRDIEMEELIVKLQQSHNQYEGGVCLCTDGC